MQCNYKTWLLLITINQQSLKCNLYCHSCVRLNHHRRYKFYEIHGIIWTNPNTVNSYRWKCTPCQFPSCLRLQVVTEKVLPGRQVRVESSCKRKKHTFVSLGLAYYEWLLVLANMFLRIMQRDWEKAWKEESYSSEISFLSSKIDNGTGEVLHFWVLIL